MSSVLIERKETPEMRFASMAAELYKTFKAAGLSELAIDQMMATWWEQAMKAVYHR